MVSRRRLLVSSALVIVAAGCTSVVRAEPRTRLLAGGLPTLGGRFVWSDEVVLYNWRIQKNAVIGHYRLIDPNDRQQVMGTFERCQAQLEEIKKEQNFPPLPKDVVIVLHGLGAARQFMDGLAAHLETEGGLAVINVGYPSTMEDIDSYAASLDSVIRHLDGVESISFVAHSMGNIVIRRYLYNLERLTPAMRPPVTFQRMVMISPPNHGAEVADGFADNKLIQMAAGKPLEQLAPSRGWPELEKQLATPSFEFGIVAGGQGDDAGYLPQIPGDDDMLLSIDTMKLAGAVDFVQTKGIHQLMPKYKVVREVTLRFLQSGYFISAEARHPIAAAEAVVLQR